MRGLCGVGNKREDAKEETVVTPVFYRRMFGADETQIRELGGFLFLILGWKRESATNNFSVNGDPIRLTYTDHRLVASAKSPVGLLRAAKRYQRLQGMTVEHRSSL